MEPENILQRGKNEPDKPGGIFQHNGLGGINAGVELRITSCLRQRRDSPLPSSLAPKGTRNVHFFLVFPTILVYGPKKE